jgi:pyruvate/2-oxoglutarate dehydrogenase complex dihydrolipoamide acyltransferase (E2) component
VAAHHDKHVDKPAVVATYDRPAPPKVEAVKVDKPIATFDRPGSVDAPLAAVAISTSTSALPTPPAPPPPAPVMPTPPPAPVVAEIPTLPNALVERVAAGHGRELSQCEGGSTLHGDIAVRFMVDPAGRVQKPQIATRITNMPKLTACILRSIMRWQFPKQGPEGASGSYTLSFQ